MYSIRVQLTPVQSLCNRHGSPDCSASTPSPAAKKWGDGVVDCALPFSPAPILTGSLAPDLRRPSHPPLTGSTLIRALAELSGANAPASADAFAQRVSQWFDWTHAISLSAVVSHTPASRDGSALRPRPTGTPFEREARDVARVRTALQKLIADAPAAGASEMAIDFPTYRQRYAACQQALDAQIGPLRRRIRTALADQRPELAKLAELDQLMEQVVGEQERALLATVAARLAPRFEQLRQQHETPADAPEAAATDWLRHFHQDMRSLLRAELDLRLQPVEGLLEAGRQPPSAHRHE